MAEVLEGAGFWLPSEFFADEDSSAMSKLPEFEKNVELCFPSEFPYSFETAKKDEFLECLKMSTSPQSTLGNWSGRSAGASSNGSPTFLPSPPITPYGPKNDAVGDLIHLVAGQVAKLKMDPGHRYAPPRKQFHDLVTTRKNPNPFIVQNSRSRLLIVANHQNEGRGIWYASKQQQLCHTKSRNAIDGMGRVPWANGPVGNSNGSREMGIVLGGTGGRDGGVAALKRQSAGTGVFLPRRYPQSDSSNCNTYSSDARRKPDRNICPISNNYDTMTAFFQSRSQSQTQLGGGFISGQDLLMNGRHEILSQYQRSLQLEKMMALGRNTCLPGGRWSH